MFNLGSVCKLEEEIDLEDDVGQRVQESEKEQVASVDAEVLHSLVRHAATSQTRIRTRDTMTSMSASTEQGKMRDAK